MFGSDGSSSIEQIRSFLECDIQTCPITSWTHYIQTGFVGLVFAVVLFCGTPSGG